RRAVASQGVHPGDCRRRAARWLRRRGRRGAALRRARARGGRQLAQGRQRVLRVSQGRAVAGGSLSRHSSAGGRVNGTILALGGGGFTMGPGDPALDELALELAGGACPRILFLPTAGGDAAAQIA